jgi:P4 family phage/plasmid primase-like protien
MLAKHKKIHKSVEDIHSPSSKKNKKGSKSDSPSSVKQKKHKIVVNDDSDDDGIILKQKSSKNKNVYTDNIMDSNPLDKFYDFVNKYKVEKGAEYTHTLMGEPYGAFFIPDSKMERFYNLFNKARRFGNQNETYISMTEAHTDFGPVVIDLDFKQAMENRERYYDNKLITKLVKTYNNCLRKYIDVPYEKMQAFVFEKPSPSVRRGQVCDGLHIEYPELCLRPDIQYIIREDFMGEIDKKKLLKQMPLTNDLDTIVDKGIIYSTNWLLYGCAKPSCKPYALTQILDYEGKKVPTSLYKLRELPKYLSIRKYNYDVDGSSILPYKDDVDLVDLEERLSKIKSKSEKKKDGKQLSEKTGITSIIKKASTEDFETAVQLTELFSLKRASDYITWIQVGKCLHNIDYGLLPTWIKFSKKCPTKFREGECDKIWHRFKEGGYSLASLHYWAKSDNVNGYLEFKKNKITTLLKGSLTGTPYDVAKVLVELYRYQYVCASLKHKQWFEFRNHRWIEIEEGYTLNMKISTELVSKYSEVAAFYYATSMTMEPGEERDSFHRKAENINKIISKLKTTKFKNDVMSESRILAYNDKFLERLDENRYLIGFNNGAYDLENCFFRDGCPDDYIRLNTGIDYYEYDEEDEHIINVTKFIQKIHPDKAMCKYILLLLSSYLQGHTPDEKFHIWTGTGSNGKSKLIELFQLAFGNYCGTFPITLLTHKRGGSSSANPEVADKKGVRFCVFQEPEENDKINVGYMKELSGGDRIQARGLYKDPIYFKPQFKLLLTCNKLPTIPSSDGGTWRRLRVVEFKSEFVDHPTKPNQFKKDMQLSEKLIEWKEAFMSLLIHYFAIYKKEGITEPEEVTKFTKAYQQKSDIFMEFLNDHIIKSDKASEHVSLPALLALMRNWYRENYADRKCPNKKDLKEYLLKNSDFCKALKNESLYGYKLSSTEEDEEDGDEKNKTIDAIDKLN